MKKIIFPILALACALPGVNAQDKVKISGKVEFLNPDFKMVVFRPAGFGRDTLAQTVVDPETHAYTLEVPVQEPGMAYLDCGRTQNVRVWLEKENLDIDFRGVDTAKVKIKNPPFVYIRGGKNNDLMNLINFTNFRNYQNMIAISQTTYKAEFANDESKSELNKALYDANNANTDDYMRYFAKHYADVNSVTVALQALRSPSDSLLIASTLAELAKCGPESKAVADAYIERVNAEKAAKAAMAVGKPAPNFTALTPKGKKISPKDFKGKVLLLDFWASWCGPCRGETPNLKETYERFKGKGVEFLSISIDADKAAWLKAEKDDNCPWPQGRVADEGKEVMQLYQFGGIPFILVIDKKGNIYRKQVRGKNIGKAIEDCLNGVAP